MKLYTSGANTVKIVKERGGASRVKVEVVASPNTSLIGQCMMVTRQGLVPVSTPRAERPQPIRYAELGAAEGGVATAPSLPGRAGSIKKDGKVPHTESS